MGQTTGQETRTTVTTDAYEAGPSVCSDPGSALHRVFRLLGKRWTGLLLAALMSGPGYFTELRRAVPGISERMLSDRLTELADLGRHVVSVPTFGKWGPDLAAVTGPTPQLVLVGVSTDCCVVSTALAAADAGATITVVTDACAGSSPANHRAAMDVMALYPPQITLATTAEVLSDAPA